MGETLETSIDVLPKWLAVINNSTIGKSVTLEGVWFSSMVDIAGAWEPIRGQRLRVHGARSFLPPSCPSEPERKHPGPIELNLRATPVLALGLVQAELRVELPKPRTSDGRGRLHRDIHRRELLALPLQG